MYHSRPGPLLALSRLAAAAGTLFIACPALVHAQAVTAGGGPRTSVAGDGGGAKSAKERAAEFTYD